MFESSLSLVSYVGESIKPRGWAEFVCSGPETFDMLSFEVVDLPGKPALLGLSDSIRLGLLFCFDRRVHDEK